MALEVVETFIVMNKDGLIIRQKFSFYDQKRETRTETREFLGRGKKYRYDLDRKFTSLYY